jgi:hypothetical protein
MSAAPLPVTAMVLAAMQPKTGYTSGGLSRQIGCTRMAAYQALGRMAARGQVGLRIIGGGNVYFASPADADAFGADAAAQLAQQLRDKRAENLETNKARATRAGRRNQVAPAKPGQPAPVVIAAAVPMDRTVDMSAAVWTIAPTPVSRFAVDPASIKPGAFLLDDMPAGRWSDYAVKEAASC